MYPIEYIWTKEEIKSTGINIDTVKESKLNPQETPTNSESSHLHIVNCTDMLLKATSKNATTAKNVVTITQVLVSICEPVTPTFLPKNPETIEPSKGNIIIAKYIVYLYSIEMLPLNL